MATITDAQGGNDLTTSGTVTNVVDGNFTGANLIVGAEATVSAASFNFNGSFTVAMWVKTPAGGNGGVQFLDYGDGVNPFKYRLAADTGDNRAVFTINDAGGGVEVARSPFPVEDTWHLICAFYDHAERTIGISVDAETWTTEVATAGINQAYSNGTLTFASATNSDFACSTSLLSIWSRVLTQAEVTYLYNSGTFPIKYPFTV